MNAPLADTVSTTLLDRYQRGFPLTPRPFEAIAAAHGLDERAVIEIFRALVENGLATRIGAVLAPNTLGASTLAAMRVPAERLDEVAARVSAHPAVSHNYEREDAVNLWFVVTGPDRPTVDNALRAIERETGIRTMDLRLLEPFHLDLGFPLTGDGGCRDRTALTAPDATAIMPGDRDLMAALEDGIALVPRPYRELGERIGRDEDAVIERLRALAEAAVIRRFGTIVRHRSLGYRANAMTVWDIEEPLASAIGHDLARAPGVTLAYRRRRDHDWPFNLYCMVHERTRPAAKRVIEQLNRIVAGRARDHRVLFSTRCFKQTGARVSRSRAKRASVAR